MQLVCRQLLKFFVLGLLLRYLEQDTGIYSPVLIFIKGARHSFVYVNKSFIIPGVEIYPHTLRPSVAEATAACYARIKIAKLFTTGWPCFALHPWPLAAFGDL